MKNTDLTGNVKCLVLVWLLLGGIGLPAMAKPEQWQADIARFEAADEAQPPGAGGVVFVGSSSIRLWSTLAEDFPGVALVNRGFGGSELADSVFYADRIVLPYQPRLVVLYAGDNDIKNGKTPEQVAADFRAFRTELHQARPDLPILYLSIKECPARVQWREQVKEANRLIAADCATQPNCTFVDVGTALLQPDGSFRAELFQADGTHLTRAGYERWREIVAPYLVTPAP